MNRKTSGLNFSQSGLISKPSLMGNRLHKSPTVTHKNTVVRIGICRQDGRGRFPVYGASSPNVGQSYDENLNKAFYEFYMR